MTPEHPDAQDDYSFEVYRYTSFKVPIRNEYRSGLPQMDAPFWHDLKKIPFDIVHAHCPFGSGLAARTIAHRRDIPFVATFHSKFRDDFKEALRSERIVEGVIAAIVEFFESADEVWAVNDGCAETLHEYGYHGNILIMDNATDLPPGWPSEENDRNIEAMLGIGPDVPLFIFVGQHIWQKNVRMIIEAMAQVQTARIFFSYAVRGRWPQTGRYEAHGANSGDRGTALRLPGRYRIGTNWHPYTCAVVLFCFPPCTICRHWCRGRAAACGCPTVFARGSTTAQGITEKNGFLIENSAASLADMVIHLITHPEHAHAVGEEGPAHAVPKLGRMPCRQPTTDTCI